PIPLYLGLVSLVHDNSVFMGLRLRPPPAGMGKHQDGGIKRGMAENLPFPSFIHLLFLEFAFTGRGGAPRTPRFGKPPDSAPAELLIEKPFHLAAKGEC
ncbi:hypothetical protein MM716_35425, partial [Klebsiella pneumoniae]|nr:hypothetical protein [Klebsiella pneumoniae]